MFNIFSAKPNYSQIFSSNQQIYDHIYGNRAKTASILGDNGFIDAWLSSANSRGVTEAIRREAMNGDIPSIKQMIWLADLYFNDADNQTTDIAQQFKIKTLALKDRILFCQKAIDFGLKDRSYQAMSSCAKLYMLLSPLPNSSENELVRDALTGIIKYANMFLECDDNDPELVQDAKDAIAHYGLFAQVFKN